MKKESGAMLYPFPCLALDPSEISPQAQEKISVISEEIWQHWNVDRAFMVKTAEDGGTRVWLLSSNLHPARLPLA